MNWVYSSFFLLLSLQFQCSISTIIFKKLGVTAGRVFLQTNGCSNSVRLSQRVFDKFATSWNHMSRAPASFTSLLPGYFLQILPLFYVWTVVHAILSSAITQRAGKKTTAAAKKLALWNTKIQPAASSSRRTCCSAAEEREPERVSARGFKKNKTLLFPFSLLVFFLFVCLFV